MIEISLLSSEADAVDAAPQRVAGAAQVLESVADEAGDESVVLLLSSPPRDSNRLISSSPEYVPQGRASEERPSRAPSARKRVRPVRGSGVTGRALGLGDDAADLLQPSSPATKPVDTRRAASLSPIAARQTNPRRRERQLEGSPLKETRTLKPHASQAVATPANAPRISVSTMESLLGTAQMSLISSDIPESSRPPSPTPVAVAPSATPSFAPRATPSSPPTKRHRAAAVGSTLKRAKRAAKTVSTGSAPGSAPTAEPKIVPMVKDRKKAAAAVVCEVLNDRHGLAIGMREQLGEQQVAIPVEEIANEALRAAPGCAHVLSVVAMHGIYKDTWDDTRNGFVEAPPHREDVPALIVALSAELLDSLDVPGVAAPEQFAQIEHAVVEAVPGADSATALRVIYVVPDLQSHVQRLKARCNRAMRRNVQQNTNDPVEMPDEKRYLEIEAELQVFHGIDVMFARTADEYPDLVANMLLDLALQRYTAPTHDPGSSDSSVKVKSKATVLDVTIEALTRIQGLHPRIAASVGSEARNLGNVTNMLSQLEKHGKGVWTSSLRMFMTSTDPNQNI